MKKFSYIFVIYVLTITIVPCSVYSDCCDETKISYDLPVNDLHPEDKCDSCSPMFQCSDCIASFIASSFKIELKLKSLNTVSHQHQVENITTELNGIWQPPKIS